MGVVRGLGDGEDEEVWPFEVQGGRSFLVKDGWIDG